MEHLFFRKKNVKEFALNKFNLAIDSSLCYILIKEAVNFFFLNRKFPGDMGCLVKDIFNIKFLKHLLFDKIFVMLNV